MPDLGGAGWYIGIAALMAAAAPFWQQLIGLANKLRSLVVVQVAIDDERLANAVALCVWRDFKKSPIGDKKFDGWRMFVRPSGRYELVAGETIPNVSMLMWRGWRPLFVSSDDSGDGYLGFQYLRGTWDVDKFLQECVDAYNKVQSEGLRENSRFDIIRLTGTIGVGFAGLNSGGGNDTGGAVPSLSEQDSSHMAQYRLLKYSYDELGQPDDRSNPFDTLAFPDNVRVMVQQAERWLKSKEWYETRKIPWKRSWMFYGIPGTGKTSLAKALAKYLGLPLYVVELCTMSDSDLHTAYDKLREATPCIVLYEDIDAVFQGRENITKATISDKPVGFDTFLNVLDGPHITDGLLTIITTNNPDALDHALGIAQEGTDISTRPGRIDRTLELKIMAEPERLKMAGNILRDHQDDIQACIKEGAVDTGAQFQDRCSSLALNLFWDDKERESEAAPAEVESSIPTSSDDLMKKIFGRKGA